MPHRKGCWKREHAFCMAIRRRRTTRALKMSQWQDLYKKVSDSKIRQEEGAGGACLLGFPQ